MSPLSFDDLCQAFNQAENPPAVKPVLVAPAPTRHPLMSADAARKAFISTFSQTGRHLHRRDVFRDFITLAASELDMACIRTPENIARSRQICDRYTAADQNNLKALFCQMVCALEGQFHDFLGSVYMALELGSDSMGQYFTPYHVQALMAQLILPGCAETIRKEGWLSLSEPCCGSAGMVIAYAECLLKAGFNPSEHLFASCIDIDSLAADMAFIQLSLLGIPAEVVTGNTLSMSFSRVRYTPVYYLNEWDKKFEFRRRAQAMKKVMEILIA